MTEKNRHTYCVTYIHFLCDLHTLKNLVQEPVFGHTFCFALSVCFFMHKSVHLERKVACYVFLQLFKFIVVLKSCGR